MILARNGLSVVLEMTNGSSVAVRGTLSVEGGGSVMHVMVNFVRKADIWSDCNSYVHRQHRGADAKTEGLT